MLDRGDGRLTFLTRKSFGHYADNQSYIEASDSRDDGQTFYNVRKVYDIAGAFAAEPFISHINSDRAVILTCVRSWNGASYDYLPPRIIRSETPDAAMWGGAALTLSPDLAGANFGALFQGDVYPWPASEGGHDTMGWVAFCYSQKRIAIVRTTNNWSTFSNVEQVIGGQSEALTEMSVMGNHASGYTMFIRQDGSTTDKLWVSFADAISGPWSVPVENDIPVGGPLDSESPPYCVTVSDTEAFLMMRSGKNIRADDDYQSHVLAYPINPTEFKASGGASGYGAMEPFANLGDWPSSYLQAIKRDDKWLMLASGGERPVGGNTTHGGESQLMMFTPTPTAALSIHTAKSLILGADDNLMPGGDFSAWQVTSGLPAAAGEGPYGWRLGKTGDANGGGYRWSRQSGQSLAYALRVERLAGETFTNDINLSFHWYTDDLYQLRGKNVTFSFDIIAGADLSGNVQLYVSYKDTFTPVISTDASFGGVGLYSETNLGRNTGGNTRKVFSILIPEDAEMLQFRLVKKNAGTAGAADYFHLEGARMDRGNYAPVTPVANQPWRSEYNHMGRKRSPMRRPFVVPEDFGDAVADADMTTGTGTDSTAAIQLWTKHLHATKQIGYLPGFYRHVGQLDLGGLKIMGGGPSRSGIVCEIVDTECAVVLSTSNPNLEGFTISRNMTTPKPPGGDRGHLGLVLKVNDYLTGTLPTVSGVTVRDMVLMDVTGSNESGGLGIFGDTHNGLFENITIKGGVSLAVQAHWDGDITAIGQTVTRTKHPHALTFRNINCIDSVNIGLTLSSVYDITVDGFRIKDAHQGLLFLVGDETDDFADEGKGIVGRGIRIKGISQLETGGVGTHVMQILGHGASKFRLDADGNTLQKNLPLDVDFADLKIHASGNVNDGVSLLNVTGRVDFDGVDITGTSRYSIATTNGNADVNVCGLNTDKEVRTTRSKNISIEGKITNKESPSVGVYFFGVEETRVTDTTAASGATSVSLATGFPNDVNTGDHLLFGQHLAIATRFVESGGTTIPVEPLEVVIPSGSSIIHDQRATGCSFDGKTIGSETGVRVIKGDVTLRGDGGLDCLRQAGNFTDSNVTIYDPRPRGIGSVDANTNYGYIFAGASVGTIHGGDFGRSDAMVDYAIDVAGTSHVTAVGVRFGSNAKARRIAGGATFVGLGCTDVTGGAVT